MTQSSAIFPICQRIQTAVTHLLPGTWHLENRGLLPRENLCCARPHTSLVKEKILQQKGSLLDMSARPNQRIHLRAEDNEATALTREASQTHNCSMDSRHQRLAVYTYMWARQAKIQLKHILFIRTKEQGIAWDSLRLFSKPAPAWPLAQKYAFRIVKDKIDLPTPPLPEADHLFLITRPLSYRTPISPS